MPPPAANPSENGLKPNDSTGFIGNWFRVSKKEFRAPHAQKSTTLHNPAAGPRPLSPHLAPRYSNTRPAPPAQHSMTNRLA